MSYADVSKSEHLWKVRDGVLSFLADHLVLSHDLAVRQPQVVTGEAAGAKTQVCGARLLQNTQVHLNIEHPGTHEGQPWNVLRVPKAAADGSRLPVLRVCLHHSLQAVHHSGLNPPLLHALGLIYWKTR